MVLSSSCGLVSRKRKATCITLTIRDPSRRFALPNQTTLTRTGFLANAYPLILIVNAAESECAEIGDADVYIGSHLMMFSR